MPNAAPNLPIRPGHSRPSSYDSTVPDTAPTATSTAMTFDQRRASSSAAASPRLMPIHSAVMVTAANAMPKQARMMWNPSDDPICDRAGTGFTARTCATAPIARPPSAACPLHVRIALQSRHAMCTATALRVHVAAPATLSQRCIGYMSSRNVGAVAVVILLGLVVGTLGLVAA